MGVIRVLLALSVLFDHSSAFPPTGNTFVGGRIAVESFFMVSGFYMALVLEGKYSKSSKLGDFYHNRLLRIFPSYFLVVGGVWILHRALGSPGVIGHILSQDWPWYAKVWMLVSNFTMIGSDWMMFFYPTAHGIHFTPNFRLPAQAFYSFHMDPVAWSLPLELMFYGLAPWVVKKPLGLVLLAVGSLYVRVLCYQAFGDNDPWTYRFFPSELLFFCAGALAFHAWFRLKGLRWTRLVGYAAFALLCFYIMNFDRMPVWLGDNRFFSGPITQFYAFLFLCLPFVFEAARKNAYDRWLGDLSYPLYLVHVPVIGSGHLPRLTSVPVYNFMLYSFAAAILIHYCFQSPLEKRFKRGG